MFKIKKIKKKGFSIGEVMLSVFILGSILTALISLYSVGINHLRDERENVIASLLAQEGVELVRNIRDNNWVSGEDSFEGFSGEEIANCSVRHDSTGCGNSNDFDIDFLDGSTNSKFKRRIQIAQSANEITVTSLVSWDNSSPSEIIDPDDLNNCTTANKCVFSQAVLSRWGEPN